MDFLFYEAVIVSDREVELAEREAEHVHKMAMTLLDLIHTNPDLRSFVENYGKAS